MIIIIILLKFPFKLKFKESIIDHDSKNPFVENKKQPLDLLFFYDTELQTFYRKYLKIVDYKTENFWYKNKNLINQYYLEDFEDTSRMNAYNNNIYDGKFLGTFRLLLAKKKEVYIRKYIYFTDFFSKMGGYISILKTIFSFFTLFLVNPNDNIRIFNFLKKNKPSIYKRSLSLIKESYNNTSSKMEYIFDGRELDEIKGKDKFFYLLYKRACCCKNKCCKKYRNKNKHLEAIDNFFKENLTIDKYLEESFLNKDKDKSIKKYINKNNINEDKIKKEIMIELDNNNEHTDIDIEKNISSDDLIKNEILFRADSLKDEEKNKIQENLSNIEKEIQNINMDDGKNNPLINIDKEDS